MARSRLATTAPICIDLSSFQVPKVNFPTKFQGPRFASSVQRERWPASVQGRSSRHALSVQLCLSTTKSKARRVPVLRCTHVEQH